MTTFRSKARKMTARFQTTCPHCQGTIAKDSEMVYRPEAARGWKSLHVDCARAMALPSKIFALGMKALSDDFNEIRNDPYGDPLTWIEAGKIKAPFATHLPNEPVTAYPDRLDDGCLVVLYWR